MKLEGFAFAHGGMRKRGAGPCHFQQPSQLWSDTGWVVSAACQQGEEKGGIFSLCWYLAAGSNVHTTNAFSAVAWVLLPAGGEFWRGQASTKYGHLYMLMPVLMLSNWSGPADLASHVFSVPVFQNSGEGTLTKASLLPF